MITFHFLSSKPYVRDLLGLIPSFFRESDPRSAIEQIDEAYAHGGGWRPIPGWTFDAESMEITYGDETYRPFAYATLHGETIFVYPYAWVCVVAADGTFQVARID